MNQHASSGENASLGDTALSNSTPPPLEPHDSQTPDSSHPQVHTLSQLLTMLNRFCNASLSPAAFWSMYARPVLPWLSKWCPYGLGDCIAGAGRMASMYTAFQVMQACRKGSRDSHHEQHGPLVVDSARTCSLCVASACLSLCIQLPFRKCPRPCMPHAPLFHTAASSGCSCYFR